MPDMYTLRYSHEASVIKWDRNTFTDLRGSEADDVVDEIEELVQSLNIRPVILKNIVDLNERQNETLPYSLRYDRPRKGPTPLDWPLDKAKVKANEVCSQALLRAKKGHDNLRYAKDVHDEYLEEGKSTNDNSLLHLDKPTEEEVTKCGEDGVYRRLGKKKVDAIGWGDEEVTNDNCEDSEDGTVTYQVRAMYFADPYGCEAFNVVELIIKVEVVPSEEDTGKKRSESDSGQKRKSEAISPQKK